MEKKLFYRVCHKDTLQGLWYDYKGLFTGKIHNEFDFCTHNKLKMDFDSHLIFLLFWPLQYRYHHNYKQFEHPIHQNYTNYNQY
jgi:hypothetical protein